MTVRTIQPDDAEPLRALWNRAAQHDPLSTHLLQEKIWSDPDFDPQLTRMVLANDQFTGWGMAVHRRQPASRGHLKFLVVDLPHQRTGIGARILTELEEELRRRGCAEIRIDEATPNYLNPGIDIRYASGTAFLSKHDYQETGQAVHQRVDLSARTWGTESDERELRTANIVIDRAKPDDADAVMTWLAVDWPAWIAEVKRAFANDPVTLHLAWRQRQVIGFAAHDTNNVGVGWFGPMGTDPACRGHGIGRILLWRCLADQRRQGYSHVIIPWVGPVDFYRQHADAEIYRTFRRMTKSMNT